MGCRLSWKSSKSNPPKSCWCCSIPWWRQRWSRTGSIAWNWRPNTKRRCTKQSTFFYIICIRGPSPLPLWRQGYSACPGSWHRNRSSLRMSNSKPWFVPFYLLPVKKTVGLSTECVNFSYRKKMDRVVHYVTQYGVDFSTLEIKKVLLTVMSV